MSSSLFESLARGLSALLSPIGRVVENPGSLKRLLATLGVMPQADTSALLGALDAVAQLKKRIEALAGQSAPSFENIAAVLDASADAFEALRQLERAGGPLSALEGLGQELVTLLVIAYLESRAPALRHAAALLTLIEAAEDQPERPPVVRDGRLLREPYRLERFHLDRLPKLLRDPVATLRAEYGSSLATAQDARAMADKLFPRLLRLLRALGVSCRYGYDPADEAFLGDAAPLMAHSLIVYTDDPLNAAALEAGLVLSLSSAQQGDLGLVISPFGTLSSQRFAGPWTIALELTAGVDVVAWGRHGVTLLASPGTVEVTGRASATLASPPEQPAYVLGDPEGTRFELAGATLAIETSLSAARQSLGLSAEVAAAALVIAPGDGDGFLASILPADGLRANVDLGLAWSSDKGLTLRGGTALEATLPVALSVGGLSLSAIHLGLRARDADVLVEASGTLGLSIGPVRALVDRLGLRAALTFPPAGGNLGVADLDLGFKPPSGIGLSVDAGGVVTGGGFLFHDAAQHLYAGVMQLSLHEIITLKAFGLIATRMPDGSKGYSMIVFITVEDFRPLPLGMGFNLLGIGGMVAVHRTFSVEAMRAGLENNALGNLLFPKDPVGNAPALIRGLATIFPARSGSYLLGVLVKIGWGTPTLVTLALALILEFGKQRRLIVLGRISALLPTADNDLIRLNLDAFGVLDFDQGTAAIDAVLVDSRLAHKFALTGAMALRARWTSGPGAGFVLAVGGLNPRFAPPAGLPVLKRVSIALSSGDNPRLTCEAYFAITSNTLQFGARAQLYAAAYGFSVQGDVGFDVLVQFVPFHFLAEFQASVQLKRGSRNLFKVSVAGELEGPRPLRVSGKASFEILWCDFSVRFDKTLIDGEKPPLPPAVDVLAELRRALASPQSWTTRHAPNRQHGVALRKLAPGPLLVLDPLGQLVVRQQVVPLNTARDVDSFGGAPVAGARRFRVGATLGSSGQTVAPVRDQFAPAQFFTMSDDEKLASPSFEEMDAGLVFGSDALGFDEGATVPAPLVYESIVVDDANPEPDPNAPPPPPDRYVLTLPRLQLQSGAGAVALAPIRSAGLARFRDAAPAQAATLRAPEWTILPLTAEAGATPVATTATTWTEKRAALAALNRGGARWQLVPAHELAS